MNTKHSTREGHNFVSRLDKLVFEAGVIVLQLSSKNELTVHGERNWLADLLIASPMVKQAITNNAVVWNEQSEPNVIEAFQGVWLAPVRKSKKSRSAEYTVGIIITDDLCTGEHFFALCQGSGADAAMVKKMILSANPLASHDVNRLGTMFQFAWELQATTHTTQNTMESVGSELADSYEEINLLYTITSNMKSVDRPERFIELACSELLQTLPYEWIGVQLRIGQRLPRLGNELIVASDLQQDIHHLSGVVRTLTNDIDKASPIISIGNDKISVRLGQATIIEPIVSDGNVIGVLLAADKQGDDPTASSVDIKLLSATATQLAIFLENALLYEDLSATFLGTLEALTASIDAKDKYTCGHSMRVALLTSQLAVAAGLDDKQVERFRIAGLVHDIGKIGVPEHVLLKKESLTDEEFQEICKHPEIGARILRDIPQMEDILGGVLHHHEKYNGGGYPHGISGNSIPLVARMIALADTFDAMSSNRTYRSAMTRQSVLDEMKRVSGTQFDPVLAELFFQLDLTQWEQLMIEHQVGVPITNEEETT